MVAPVDRVQVLKTESTAAGGDDADIEPWSEILDSNEDAIEVQGVFFQPPKPDVSKDETVYITRDSSGNLLLKDQNANGGSEILLSSIGGGAPGPGYIKVSNTGGLYYDIRPVLGANGQLFTDDGCMYIWE